jgi:hypothetical protein
LMLCGKTSLFPTKDQPLPHDAPRDRILAI